MLTDGCFFFPIPSFWNKVVECKSDFSRMNIFINDFLLFLKYAIKSRIDMLDILKLESQGAYCFHHEGDKGEASEGFTYTDAVLIEQT